MCQAVSVVSGLDPGVSPATHSPQPVPPSTFASISTMRRSSVRMKLVSNGVTSFILNSRSAISRIRIFRDVLSLPSTVKNRSKAPTNTLRPSSPRALLSPRTHARTISRTPRARAFARPALAANHPAAIARVRRAPHSSQGEPAHLAPDLPSRLSPRPSPPTLPPPSHPPHFPYP